MNVFFSGSRSGVKGAGTDDDPRLLEAASTHYRLASVHSNYLTVAKSTVETVIETGYGKACEVMVDSGAFTAWSKGEEVDLNHLISIYSQFIDDYEHHVKQLWFINLDKIPAERGRTATGSEIIEAMQQSNDNFGVLKDLFKERVLPVYHQNEPKEQLMLLQSESGYICISPRNDVPEQSRVTWSREVHEMVPGLKTHGLAATGAKMMAQVPWGSVDSATWVAIGAYGGVILEGPQKLRILQISNQSGSVKELNKHFDNLADIEQEALAERFKSYGFTVESLREEHVARMLFNRIALIKYSARYSSVVAKQNAPLQGGLFGL